MSERRYLSIGEVLGLLLEEFPDVTISKIRFLETQGLIDPERTQSGYRKFYDEDVERLRMILREQRENFLPLRVIKDRLETGELSRPADPTPTGSIRLPRSRRGTIAPPLAAATRPPEARPQAPPLSVVGESYTAATSSNAAVALPAPVADIAAIDASQASHPAARLGTARGEAGMTAEELCAHAGVDTGFLDRLEEFGIVTSGRVGGWRTYDADSIRAVVAAAQLCKRGLEPRHLRQWRQAVDRDVALIEQLVAPLLRQRNPAARDNAAALALDIEQFGEELRAALTSRALRHLIG